MQELRTRQPSCQPSWPIILLAGVEGGGKSWTAAEATGLPMIDRAFYLEIGERMADEYGAVPGASFEIIEHNGTYLDLLSAATLAGRVKPPQGKANMLIVDSISELWQLLQDEAQLTANKRARGRKDPNGDHQITMDLWNFAKSRYDDFMQALRSFPGPVIITARLDNVMLVDGGKPTGEKIWKPRAEKNTPFYAQVVAQARRPREWVVTKVASTKMQLAPGGEMPFPNFTIGALLDAMGITANTTTGEFVRPSGSGLPVLPIDPEARVSQLEKTGDRDALVELWKLFKAHERDDLMQIASEAGKRLADRAKQQQAPQQTRQMPPHPDTVSMTDAVQSIGEVMQGEIIEAEVIPAHEE